MLGFGRLRTYFRRNAQVDLNPKLPAKEVQSDMENISPTASSQDAPEEWREAVRFPGEAQRMAVLQSLCILHTQSEPRFDSITRLMAATFNTPVALVALIESNQLWFKSVAGPFGSCINRKGSLCDQVLVPDTAEVLFVEDLAADSRFANSPLVRGDPYLRFYAGAPLVGSAGHRYGTLCVLDLVPRTFPVSLLSTLVNFAELVVREMERDAATARDKTALRSLGPLARSTAAFTEPVALLDVQSEGWRIVYANAYWAKEVDLSADGGVGMAFWDLFDPGTSDVGQPTDVASAFGNLRPIRLPIRRKGPVGDFAGEQCVVLRASTDSLAANIPIGIPGFVPPDEQEGGNSSSGGGTKHWFATLRRKEGPGSPTQSPRYVGTIARSSVASSVYPHASASSPSFSAENDMHPYGLVPPEKFTSMRLGPLLGAGAIAKVHRAVWEESEVAVKVIEVASDQISGASELDRAVKEGIIGTEVDHPNCVRTLDFARSCKLTSQPDWTGDMRVDTVWIVQELCDHGRLSDAMERGWLRVDPSGPPDMLCVLRTAADIAAALAHLHDHEIIHGDLTGNNVLLSTRMDDPRGFIARVADFGLSKIAPVSRETQRYGTISHMPPEVLENGLFSPATDIYSFGVLMWEMWTGTRAWCGQRPAAIILAVTSGLGKLPIPAEMPSYYAELITRCLATQVKKRPTAQNLYKELHAYVDGFHQRETAGCHNNNNIRVL